MTRAAETYPHLLQLWGQYLEDIVEDDPRLDPQLVIDDVVARTLRAGRTVAAELAEAEAFLLDVDGDEARAEQRWYELTHAHLPDGRSYVDWLRVQRQVLQNAVEGRAPMPLKLSHREMDGLRLPRVSRFTDEATANAAVTKVLRAHEDAFRSWAADPGGWARQHYYADLGREVGRIQYAKDEPTQAATAVAVVMARHPETGAPFVRTAYPETTLDQGARRRFPDLCHWFGAWFHQDNARWDDVWDAIADVNRTTTDPARSRVRDQLTDLLTITDDAELAAAVHALGSYTLPTRMRWWVERTVWRLDAYDWLATRT
ncbi:contact-dependent growth inhibition system immunity protein [Thalassiella azotivora]